MQKIYVADVVGDEYERWYYHKNKVFLDAPMGMGKTRFITDVLFDFILRKRNINIHHNDKLLILCNRRMLGLQYWWEMIEKRCSYHELKDVVEIKSYQEIAASIRGSGNVDELLQEYSCVVCDEVHYFYADSDFNCYGTFAVMHALLRAGICKMMIFMSATGDEIFPILEKALKKQFKSVKNVFPDLNEEYRKIVLQNLQSYRNFDYVHPYLLKDDKELIYKVGHSSEKWLIFIDCKERGKQLLENIRKNGKTADIIHADNLDKDSRLVSQLVMNGQLDKEVLITTSVLDNGVSLKDPLLRNIVIMTDSPVSFVQMLGRIRVGEQDIVNLYLIKREASEFKKRAEASKKLLDKFEKALEQFSSVKAFDILCKVFDDPWSEEAEDYRKIYTLTPEGVDFIPAEYSRTRLGNNFLVTKRVELYINELAMEKTGDAFKMQSLLYKRAMSSPEEVAYEQISWIGKTRADLIICSEDYLKKNEEQLINELESFGMKTADEVGDFKKHLVSDFPDVVSRYVKINKGTFSKNQLVKLCECLGFKIINETVNGKIRYTISRRSNI